MDAPICNCPRAEDVFREGVTTKPPCPVHPEPDLSDLLPLLKPQRDCYGFGAEHFPNEKRY